MRAVGAVARAELRLSLRQGEQLLVSMGIPVLVLVFFSLVDVLPTETAPHAVAGGPEMRAVDSLFPRVLALAVVSSAMVSLGIGTGFERHYKVLKRLGATPLGRPRLVLGKVVAVAATLALQLAVLTATAVALGWRPGRFDAPPAPQLGLAIAACILGTAAFGGIGLALAGRLPGLVNLAATNALYLVLLLAGGIAVPLDELPGPMAAVGRALPTGALVEVLVDALVVGEVGSWSAWAVLAAWAVATPLVAAAVFRWE